jgi:hypothetical protein
MKPPKLECIVETAWEINKILVELSGEYAFLLYDPPTMLNKFRCGICQSGSFELSLEEAEGLVKKLQVAIGNYKEQEESAKKYFEENPLEGLVIDFDELEENNE